MKSVLKEAEMLDLKDAREVDPNGTIDFFTFKKLIIAQNSLLYGCYKLLYNLGMKLAIYLYPYGKSFQDVVEEITELIKTDWDVQIIDQGVNSFTVEIKNCVFCHEIGVPCQLFFGFLVQSLKKSLPENKNVTYVSEKDTDLPHSHILKLIWK
ncbi:MAG: hypothetical protein EU540_00210 [Promethearchaeota archaeon]|nr:MAG: hypothetical protein EU540_00210 [Candidatus Lokiarchaeota archaeon]